MARHHRVVPGVALLATWLAGCNGDPAGTGEQESLLNPHIQPRVIGTYPETGSTGPFEELFVPGGYSKPHFLVQFNKLIDLGDFEPDWFTVEGFDRPVFVYYLVEYRYPPDDPLPLPGPITSSGQLTNLLSLVVYDSLESRLEPFRVGRTYTVQVNTTLEDFTGRHPALPSRFSFTPEPSFRVIASQPADGDENVGLFNSLWITFNSRIKTTVFPSLRLSPEVAGEWKIVSGTPDSNAAFFQHLEPFPFGSNYTLTVTADAQDASGNRLPAPVSTRFGVQPFKIQQSYPQDGATEIGLSNPISMFASGPLDTATARAAFHIEPPTPGELRLWYYDPIVFYPFPGLLPGTRYTVTLSTKLRAYDGTPLSAPYSFSFTTDTFHVTATNPADGGFGVNRIQPITFYCTQSVDLATVRPGFGISPDITGTFSLTGTGVNFQPITPLAANTIYRVTISTALRSSTGVPLAAPYTFAFRTGD